MRLARFDGSRIGAVRDDSITDITELVDATAPDPAYTASGRRPVVSVGTDGTVFVLDGGSLIRFPRTEDTTKPAKDAPAEIAGL